MTLSKFVLGWAAVLGIGFGLGYVVVPAPMFAWIGLTDLAPIALTDLRTMYAVAQVPAGLLFAAALRREAWVDPGLFLVAAIYTTLLVVRSIGLALDGSGSTYHYAALAFEIPTAAAAIVALRGRAPASRDDANA